MLYAYRAAPFLCPLSRKQKNTGTAFGAVPVLFKQIFGFFGRLQDVYKRQADAQTQLEELMAG